MSQISDITEFALQHFGIPYQWGGEGYNNNGGYGYDCSGFVKRLGARGGIRFAQDLSAKDLFAFCVRNGKADHGEGSWVFFSQNGEVFHVGYTLMNGVMISAAGGGPECTTIEIAKAKNASIKIQPLWWYHKYKLEGSFMPPYKF